MTRIAFVFPGQGSQVVGMGRELAISSPAAAAVFAAADRALAERALAERALAERSLGEPLSTIAWEGPEDTLNRTENAQPALLAASIAVLAALRERWRGIGVEPPEPAFAAGHSMGQYSALVAAGSISLEDGIRLVRERGRLMQASGDGREGRMAAVIGLDDARLPELVERASAHGVFGLANRNSPGQIVVSGERGAVEAAIGIAKELGAKRAIELPVSVAAHSPLMARAAEGMRLALDSVAVGDPHPPLLANGDGHEISTGAAARAELVDHLTTGVDWVAVVQRMASEGVTTFVEIGPGRVLTGLIKRIVPGVEALATDDPSASDRLAVPFVTAGAA